jgi:nitroreductase
LAESVYEPSNIRGAQLVVAIVGRSSFDTGRAAQNMLLVAWNEGVGSCPNGLSDSDSAHEALGLGTDEEIAIVLTFGYPARDRDPLRHTAEEWSARANRKPLDELTQRL